MFGRISYLFDLRLDVFHIYFSSLSSRDQKKRLTSSFIDGWRLYSLPLQCLPARRQTGVLRPRHVNPQARGLIRSSCQLEDIPQVSDLGMLIVKFVILCVRMILQQRNVFDYNAPFFLVTFYRNIYIYTVNPPITRLIRTALYGNRAIRNPELIQIRLFVPRYIETIAALYGNRAIRNLELIQIRLFVPRYIETMLSEFQK